MKVYVVINRSKNIIIGIYSEYDMARAAGNNSDAICSIITVEMNKSIILALY